MSIYVGNLSYEASQENLNEVFAEYVRLSEFSYPLIEKQVVHAGLHL